MDDKLPELRNCTICKNDKIDRVERDFLADLITGKEACELLECSMNAFKTHIEKHLKRDIAGVLSANAPMMAKRIFDKTAELISSCDRMLAVIKEVQIEWSQKKKPEWITALVKLETVLSNNIEKLTKIHGELRESSVMRVEQLNIQVNNMTQELIEGMCSACKQKLAPKILRVVGIENAPSSETTS